MKITVVCAGKLKEKYLRDGVAEYEKRLRPYADLRTIEIIEERMKDRPSLAEKEEVLRREGERLSSQIPQRAYLIVLDVGGEEMSSEKFSARIDRLILMGESHIAFLIGGPFGLSDELRQRADLRLSFSQFTLPHQLIRLFLMEQIYRSFKISRHEPYHL
ncbi:23S rRNA (pseudouridine(1915)-N(3))-methyltransferase RlmH [Selenomonas flueggei]|uniref:Ribosomal RNA large subunit methyltransferase H n=1 Tax=Selenomonas flueggei ATCC 43531 TaxID=638302 RepID=C4V2L3_9FIRM|nr:23S rRNA (pseudouridine(1915)-N(3))-methyltransferase RlmH [Selenomonas flueggei]EEQ49027.1 putative rRNA large subunit m3Psi methyltransferase RlmH [Selenomonas flueggei ATCC 43531]